jgi:putative DNA methylase
MVITTTTRSLIEVQFPVSKLSKESYKERKAGSGQTLTGLGKWWGRKPLILVRAILLGLLMSASSDSQKDQEIFLKILTMDDDGLQRRKRKSIPIKEIYTYLSAEQREKWFEPMMGDNTPRLRAGITKFEKENLQYLVFNLFPYEKKIEYCDRPEDIEGPSKETWQEINNHLQTNATNIQELVHQLGKNRFGHIPSVGDAFCGGGSIPFEAARIGFHAYGSDLNPVASLLTWAALNIVGGGAEIPIEVRQAQQNVYNAVNQQIADWGIEHNEQGWQADAYIYCNETLCPECGWLIPLAPSWSIGERTRTIGRLIPNPSKKSFDIIIDSGVSETEMESAKKAGTVKDSLLLCPNPACGQSTPLAAIRDGRYFEQSAQYGLRMWEKDDLIPQPGDTFQERLYCIRWIKGNKNNDKEETIKRLYRAPDEKDFQREEKVLHLLSERFQDWCKEGYIPTRQIEPGDKTNEPIRTRGWTYWHHLFNPRQLLVIGCLLEQIMHEKCTRSATIGMLLSVGRSCDYNARLSRWHPHKTTEKSEQVFSNQALNTLYNYGTRTLHSLRVPFFSDCFFVDIDTSIMIQPLDARNVTTTCDIWFTDPPYSDAIAYHELSEFFLAWYEKHLQKLLPDWYTDSKRHLAIWGSGEKFRKDMFACYSQLTDHMPEQGLQVIMFTHQSVRAWSDLTQILWASRLCVTAAWCIATETESALKKGNYVQATVILVLRKQMSGKIGFMDEVYYDVEREVKTQLTDMFNLNYQDSPNFSDTDYHLAAYAAAIRALTCYINIDGRDVAQALLTPPKEDQESIVEKIIAYAVKIACDYLVPRNVNAFIWRTLTAEERFYLKGIELEKFGEYRIGAYQELARGFGVKEYSTLLSSAKANNTRLKTPMEFSTRILGNKGFGSSLLRNALFAIREIIRSSEVFEGKNWLHTQIDGYWDHRKTLIEILHYLEMLKMPQWENDSNAARLLAGALENDHI